MSGPLVSVSMTVYNREKYVQEAIESVINQTYQNWELIIVDDCSKDDSVDVIKTFVRKDKRIQFHQNQINLGDYPNRNKAVSYSKGEILVSVDSDDTIVTDALEHIVNLFDRFPESAFLTLNSGDFYQEENLITSEEYVRMHFFGENHLGYGPGATAIRKVFFKRIGGFPETYGPACDLYYNILAASNSPVIVCKKEFLNYRIHEGQESNNILSYIHNGYNCFNDILQIVPLPLSKRERAFFLRKSKRRFLVNLLRYLFKSGDFLGSFRAVGLAKFTFKDAWIAVFNF